MPGKPPASPEQPDGRPGGGPAHRPPHCARARARARFATLLRSVAKRAQHVGGPSRAPARGDTIRTIGPLPSTEATMTLLHTDPLFLKHDTGRHTETAQRLRSISARLDRAGLVKKCTAGTYQPLTEAAVARLHAAKQVQSVKQLAAHGGGRLD